MPESSVVRKNEASLHSDHMQGWYKFFFNRLVADGGDKHLESHSHVSLINFNYDRSLDYWLLMAVKRRFNVTIDEARRKLAGLRIIRVHGSLGGSPLSDASARPYHQANTREEIERCANSIFLTGDDGRNSGLFGVARDCLMFASDVVFLGFGYHSSNLDRLQLRQVCFDRQSKPEFAMTALQWGLPESARILGTAQGLSEGQIRDLFRPLSGLIDPDLFKKHANLSALAWLKENPELLRRN
ncbi:MAG: hypothetical protein IPK67_18640 [Planctomycetes bacterium]|nr:hypothetical protein [Planctomycetota bacterium]